MAKTDFWIKGSQECYVDRKLKWNSTKRAHCSTWMVYSAYILILCIIRCLGTLNNDLVLASIVLKYVPHHLHANVKVVEH